MTNWSFLTSKQNTRYGTNGDTVTHLLVMMHTQTHTSIQAENAAVNHRSVVFTASNCFFFFCSICLIVWRKWKGGVFLFFPERCHGAVLLQKRCYSKSKWKWSNCGVLRNRKVSHSTFSANLLDKYHSLEIFHLTWKWVPKLPPAHSHGVSFFNLSSGLPKKKTLKSLIFI